MEAFSSRELTSLFMNAAALMLLFGLYYTTDIYRERGRFDDKLFFAMILVNVVIAVSDGTSYIFDMRTRFFGVDKLMILANSTLLYGMAVYGGLLLVLVHFRLFRDEERTRRVLKVVLFGEAVLLFFYLLNVPFCFFFTVDKTNAFIYGPFFNILPYIAEILSAAPCVYTLFVRKKTATARYIPAMAVFLLTAADLVVASTIDDVSIYGVSRAIILCYLHMAILNEEFYAKGGASA